MRILTKKHIKNYNPDIQQYRFCIFDNIDMLCLSLENVTFLGCTFINCSLAGCEVKRGLIKNCTFITPNFNNTVFDEVEISIVTLLDGYVDRTTFNPTCRVSNFRLINVWEPPFIPGDYTIVSIRNSRY